MSTSPTGDTPFIFPSLADTPHGFEECRINLDTSVPSSASVCDASETFYVPDATSTYHWTPPSRPVISGHVGPLGLGLTQVATNFPHQLALLLELPVPIFGTSGTVNIAAGFSIPSSVWYPYSLDDCSQLPGDLLGYSNPLVSIPIGSHDGFDGTFPRNNLLLVHAPFPHSSNLQTPDTFDGTDLLKLQSFLDAICILRNV